MERSPQEIVRSIRLALGMTQVEFARALGWSATTISRWESGRARPNRLALKIVLAYGEEHHVRLKRESHADAVPESASTELVCLTDLSGFGGRALPAPLADAEPGSTERESLADWTRDGRREVSGPASSRALSPARPVADHAERPPWRAEVRLRLSGPSRSSTARNRGSWLRSATLLAGALVVLGALGMPIVRSFAPDADRDLSRAAAGRVVARSRVGLPRELGGAPVAAESARNGGNLPVVDVGASMDPTLPAGRVLAAPSGARPGGPSELGSDSAPATNEVGGAGEAGRLTMGQLAGVLLAGGARRVTVRTPSGPMIFTEGDRVGDNAIARVAPDRIELREDSGRSRIVRLGENLPLE